MALIHTDLPLPVEPAISRCGILVRSATCTLPAMSLPSGMTMGLLLVLNSAALKMLYISTALACLLGTSMPTAALPGIGASMRTPAAARFSAISSARPVMRLIFTPAAGCNSYRVTAGPRLISINLVCTPKLASVLTSSSALWRNSVSSPPVCVTLLRSNRDSGG
ncbi:hypothetical protein SDC9_153466 [bioreactor metagenome]|uniref:Uncharacterized protein n=1 Tax=bioreactor metagenome TaxID=1076179 RepID=A0A645EXL7_9ZZZZ